MSNYKEIDKENNPKLIKNISDLRYYVKKYTYTDKLCEYLNLTANQIYNLVKFGIANTNIECIKGNLIEQFLNREEYEMLELTEKEDMAWFNDNKDNFCVKFGLTRTKRFLNSKIKQNDINAKIFKLFIEAKEAKFKSISDLFHQDYHLNKYNEAILKVIELYKGNKLDFGFIKINNSICEYFLSFILPNNSIISFPFMLFDLDNINEYQLDSLYLHDVMKILDKSIYETYKTEIEKKKLEYLLKDSKKNLNNIPF